MIDEVRQRVLEVWRKHEPRIRALVAKEPEKDRDIAILVDGVFDAVEYRGGEFKRIKVFVTDGSTPGSDPFTAYGDNIWIEYIDL